MRLYYKKAVNENTSHAFSYDLTGLVSPMKIAPKKWQNNSDSSKINRNR
jgi:hypothetical protein